MESTLADTYWDVIGEVASNAGWGRGSHFGDEEWDETKTRTLKSIVKSGLRQFYHPPVDQSGVSHQWSFLKPLVRLSVTSGQREVMLPIGFGGVEGSMNLITEQGGVPGLVKVTGGVRARYAVQPNATGRPVWGEIEPLRNMGKDHGQRWQLILWPESSADYTLEFYHSIAGEMLTGELPYAYGGAEHSETIQASCLAVWEHRIEDLYPGPKLRHWMDRLAVSISKDREKKPQTLGYNGDRSDYTKERRGTGCNRYGYGYPPLKINGVLYD